MSLSVTQYTIHHYR